MIVDYSKKLTHTSMNEVKSMNTRRRGSSVNYSVHSHTIAKRSAVKLTEEVDGERYLKQTNNTQREPTIYYDRIKRRLPIR